MSQRDPELAALLLEELTRHSVAFASPETPEAARRAVHALKGSAGLAGEMDLASALERVERRIRDGDREAIQDAAAIVAQAMEHLASGQSASPSVWPEPPPGLTSSRIDPGIRAQYLAEAADRLSTIDEALAQERDVVSAARIVYRQVHTLKGAASAVGDEPMAWFCHGLEEPLRAVATPDEASTALAAVASWRGMLTALLEDSEHALASLRTRRISRRPPAPPTSAATAATAAFDDEGRSRGGRSTIRVAAESIDQVIARLESLGLVRETLATRINRGRSSAERLRRVRSSLGEALRLIGPPRPWGAPAAALRRIDAAVSTLALLAEDADAGVAALRSREQLLSESLDDTKKSLGSIRLTTMGRLFARLTRAVESDSMRTGRAVVVLTRGADESVDRRLAEALFEPSLQIVRNAVAHGIESPADRESIGKPAAGTIMLSARRTQGRMSVTISDDGAGVDVREVRARAASGGLVPQAEAESASTDEALAFLFLPGLSTAARSDHLAGRGIGLDIAQSAVRRLGGDMRLSSRFGEGFTARIDVPVEMGITAVLWVNAGRATYALPALPVRAVRASGALAARRVPHLARCLGDQPDEEPAPLLVDFEVRGEDEATHTLSVGIDAVGRTENLLVRPLSRLVTHVGPYAGAIVRGDGTLRLVVDLDSLAHTVRAASVRATP